MLRNSKPVTGRTFIASGLLHFLAPRPYVAMMPDYLPAHRALVYASGAAEMAGGAALLSPSPAVRRCGAWWLLATLAGVFPANVHMAMHPERYPKFPKLALYARLPLQLVFARAVLRAAR